MERYELHQAANLGPFGDVVGIIRLDSQGGAKISVLEDLVQPGCLLPALLALMGANYARRYWGNWSSQRVSACGAPALIFSLTCIECPGKEGCGNAMSHRALWPALHKAEL